jgi:hypothetical protein
MERHRIKRLPVTRDGRMVGIVSRANLMHALASLTRDINLTAPTGGDLAIRTNILTAIEKLDRHLQKFRTLYSSSLSCCGAWRSIGPNRNANARCTECRWQGPRRIASRSVIRR